MKTQKIRTPKNSPITPAPRLVGAADAASMLGVSTALVRKWLLRGQVESHKIGGRRLIAMATIERMISESYQPATAAAPVEGGAS